MSERQEPHVQNKTPHKLKLVGAEGFEPPTACSQSRCATRLRYAPKRITKDGRNRWLRTSCASRILRCGARFRRSCRSWRQGNYRDTPFKSQRKSAINRIFNIYFNLSRFLKDLVFARKEDAANATTAANSDFKSSIFILYCFLKFIRNIKSMGKQKKNATHLCDASFNCHIIQNQVLWRYVMRPLARS